MVGGGLKKYAKEKGFNVKSGVAYGLIGGYMVTLYEGAGTKTLAVSGGISQNSAAMLENTFQNPTFRKQNRIINHKISPESIIIVFHDTMGTIKIMKAFIDALPTLLVQSGVTGDGFCTACGNGIEAGQPYNVILVNGVAHRVHSACAASVELRAEVDRDNFNRENKNVGRGIIGALLGSILGGIVWAVAYLAGWFIAVLGALIAFLSKKGYELLGGKVCKAKTVIVLVATLFGVVFGQVVGDMALIAKETVLANPDYFTWLDVPYNYFYFLSDPEFRGAVLASFAQGALFAVLGGYFIVRKSHEEDKNATLNSTILE